MKLISWNVNGLRACMQKGFAEFFTASDADIFCIQESKLQEGQIDFAPEGYYAYWNYAQKKGYSGTAIFTRKEPTSPAATSTSTRASWTATISSTTTTRKTSPSACAKAWRRTRT